MRDVITVIAAGSIMTAYALIAPTIVEAVPTPAAAPQKVFVQRLSQAGGEGPVSAVVTGTPASRTVVGHGSALPRFARHQALE